MKNVWGKQSVLLFSILVLVVLPVHSQMVSEGDNVYYEVIDTDPQDLYVAGGVEMFGGVFAGGSLPSANGYYSVSFMPFHPFGLTLFHRFYNPLGSMFAKDPLLTNDDILFAPENFGFYSFLYAGADVSLYTAKVPVTKKVTIDSVSAGSRSGEVYYIKTEGETVGKF